MTGISEQLRNDQDTTTELPMSLFYANGSNLQKWVNSAVRWVGHLRVRSNHISCRSSYYRIHGKRLIGALIEDVKVEGAGSYTWRRGLEVVVDRNRIWLDLWSRSWWSRRCWRPVGAIVIAEEKPWSAGYWRRRWVAGDVGEWRGQFRFVLRLKLKKKGWERKKQQKMERCW